MATTEATHAAGGDVMTHEELLAKLNEWEYSDYKAYGSISEWPYKTLRAVVQLHKPNDEYVDDVTVCSECYRDFYFGGEHYEYGKYPCKTIQIIKKELQ